MNYIIIFSFIVIVAMIIIAMFPRKVALYLSNVNKYDLSTVPKKMVYSVFFCSMIILAIAMFIFLYEASLVEFEIPEIFDNIEFFNFS